LESKALGSLGIVVLNDAPPLDRLDSQGASSPWARWAPFFR
jgi:hypothetical protein